MNFFIFRESENFCLGSSRAFFQCPNIVFLAEMYAGGVTWLCLSFQRSEKLRPKTGSICKVSFFFLRATFYATATWVF